MDRGYLPESNGEEMKFENQPDSSPARKSQAESRAKTQVLLPETRRSRFVGASYGIFFFSGVAALIYEISWSRQIGILLGQTAEAAAIVLSAYFVGLSLGYFFGGRWAARLSPLRAYGLAEIFAAAWACLIPPILSSVTTPEVAEWLGQTSFHIRFVSHAAFCFLLLLPATVALGMTLPLMAEFLSPESRLSIRRVSLAYAFNTLGAVLGVLSTFGLLVVVGVRASSYLAAGLSAACGLAALMLAAFSPGTRPDSATTLSVTKLGIPVPVLRFGRWEFVAGLTGFCTLALEVLYTRMFSLVFHNSTYTFGAVVAVFLVALSLGSLIISFLHRRIRPGMILAVSSFLAAIGIPFSTAVFLRHTQLKYFSYGDSFTSDLLGSFSLVVLVILPPVIMAGMILPALWNATKDSAEVGSRVLARLTMINTLMAAAGALSASFLLLPVLGLWMSFAVIALLFGLIAVGSLLWQRRFGWGLASTIAILAVTVLGMPWISSPDPITGEEGGKVLRRWESAYGWIDVVRAPGGALQIRQNVHYRLGATGLNAAREYRQAHLPLLLHPDPHDVLFLGLGTGLTAGAAIPHEEVERIQIVELIPEVIEAARLLNHGNLNVIDHPKVTIQIDDARHYLLATDRRFDVIISDLFVPWESRTGYLYTLEHYRIARERLQPDGLFCQWLPLYQIGPEEFERIANSFNSVFPHTTLWWGQIHPHRAIVALVGSIQPLKPDAVQLTSRIEAMQSIERFSDSYFSTAEHFFDLFMGEWTVQNPEKLNTDEHPWVEFLAPISHRNGTLLQGPVLRRYYDLELSQLGTGDIELSSENFQFQREKQRRAWQRHLLFGTASSD